MNEERRCGNCGMWNAPRRTIGNCIVNPPSSCANVSPACEDWQPLEPKETLSREKVWEELCLSYQVAYVLSPRQNLEELAGRLGFEPKDLESALCHS